MKKKRKGDYILLKTCENCGEHVITQDCEYMYHNKCPECRHCEDYERYKKDLDYYHSTLGEFEPYNVFDTPESRKPFLKKRLTQFPDENIEVLNISNVEIVQEEKEKSYQALFLRVKIIFKFKDFSPLQESNIGFSGHGTEKVEFYYLVQIVDGRMNDTALSEDNFNELWNDIKNIYSSKAISSYKETIKATFHNYLKESELIA